MTLYLSDDDVKRVLTTADCVEVLDDLFKQESRGLVENIPRQRGRYGKVTGTLMGGAVLGSQAYLVRHSTVSLLYNTETGKLDAILPPNTVAWIRTGAASGLATKYMARADSSVVGMIGTGRQSITQLEAICAVRAIKQVKVYSRSAENREKFAREMEDRVGTEVVPVGTTEECVSGSDVVVTITNAREPVFDGNLLEPGMHINAAGNNGAAKREIDEKTIQRADLIVLDNKDQAQIECGELITAAANGTFRWAEAFELHHIVGGKVNGRPSNEAVTLFESQGIGIEDAAASAFVLKKARELGLGQELPF